MKCEMTSPGVHECALCASSAHDVHHASVCVNVVIDVLVVLCELHVIVRVHVIPLCDDAVVGLTLSLIAHVVVVVFVLVILHRIFCIWRYTLYTSEECAFCGDVVHMRQLLHISVSLLFGIGFVLSRIVSCYGIRWWFGTVR